MQKFLFSFIFQVQSYTVSCFLFYRRYEQLSSFTPVSISSMTIKEYLFFINLDVLSNIFIIRIACSDYSDGILLCFQFYLGSFLSSFLSLHLRENLDTTIEYAKDTYKTSMKHLWSTKRSFCHQNISDNAYKKQVFDQLCQLHICKTYS